MEKTERRAYAKINLGLDVLRRRENGYHDVKMVMQTVGIYDELTFEKIKEGIIVTTDKEELPTESDLPGSRASDREISDSGRHQDLAEKEHPDRSRHGRGQHGCSSSFSWNEYTF